MTDNAQSRPKVLLLTVRDFREPRDGGALRVNAVHQQLTERIGQVDVVTVENGSFPVFDRARSPLGLANELYLTLRVGFRAYRTRSKYVRRNFRPSVVRALIALRNSGDYAASVVEYSYLTIYEPVLPKPIVVDLHNIESELKSNYLASLQAGGASKRTDIQEARRDALGLTRLERSIPHRFTRVAVVSQHDKNVLEGLTGTAGHIADIRVAPNGVSDAGFTHNTDQADCAVFVAHLGWAPNIDAALWLGNEVWPLVLKALPQARLHLVGRSPAPAVKGLASDNIEVFGDVPDVMPYVGNAKVATAPLLAAGGTRLKILEALSAGVPVVSTSMGALGLESIGQPALTIADTPSAFAEALIEKLSTSPEPRDAVRSFAEPYRWNKALDELTDLVRESVNESSTPLAH